MFSPSDVNAFKANLERFIATNRVHATTRDLTNIYATVPAAYTCANMRAENLADVDFVVVGEDGKPSADPRAAALQRVIDRNKHEYLFRSELTICFWGRNLLFKEKSLTETTLGLRWLNPHLYSLDLTGIDGLKGFRINYSSLYETIPESYLKLDEVVYQTRPIDFHDDFDAISPAEVTFQYAGATAEMATTVLSLFRNMAIPAAIAQPAQDSGGGAVTVSPEHVNMLVRMLRTIVQGAANFGRTVVSPTRWEWIQLQARFDQLAFKDISEEAKEAVFMGFRVPMVLVLGGANYAEQEGARRFWLQNWLVPQANWYASTFTRQLAGEFGNFKIIADFRNIPALKEDTTTQTNTYGAQLSSGGITVDEYREKLGYAKLPNNSGNTLYVGGVPIPVTQLGEVSAATADAEEANPTGINPHISVSKPTEVHDSPKVLASRNVSRVDEALYDELTAWERIAGRKNQAAKGKVFECRHTPIHIEHFITEGLKGASDPTAQKAVFEGARQLAAMKAIQSTRVDFDSEFNDILAEARDGNIDRRRFSTLFRSLVRKSILRAYRDALIDGGVVGGEFSDEDNANVGELIAEQSQYVTELGSVLYKEDGISNAQADVKTEMWWNKSVYPAYQRGLLSADADGMYEFAGDDGEESCGDCMRLKGQIHRYRSWAKKELIPPSGNFSCGGWNCRHKLVRVSERERGGW